jgi:Holliday junction DNA helicase RuvB
MSNIRPVCFDEITGQSDVIGRLRVSVAGCKSASATLPHVLIDGPPGLGKTTVANAIAHELGVNLYTTNAANIRSVKNILPYLMNISRNSVLFIDEIHRLPKIVEEFLYPVMEDFVLNIILDKEPEKIDIPPFTLVGATTSGGSLSQPFYDRFTIKEHLTFYSDNELAKLAGSNSIKMGIVIDDQGLLEIAKRSKGTPRILNSRLLWYKNYKICNPLEDNYDVIFEAQGIDNMGLDIYDRMYLDILRKSKGSPLGLKAISSMTGISIETIENSIEPYMIRKGLVIRTSKGRILSSLKI